MIPPDIETTQFYFLSNNESIPPNILSYIPATIFSNNNSEYIAWDIDEEWLVCNTISEKYGIRKIYQTWHQYQNYIFEYDHGKIVHRVDTGFLMEIFHKKNQFIDKEQWFYQALFQNFQNDLETKPYLDVGHRLTFAMKELCKSHFHI